MNDFRDVMIADGLEPPHKIEPDRWYRFPGAGKRTGDAGRCKLFADGAGGVYQDLSTGLSRSWQAGRDSPYTAAEREAFKKHCEAARADREAEDAKTHADAAIRAAAIRGAARPAGLDHPYARRKKISVDGLREYKEALVIPMSDAAGALHSLQLIAPDGGKKFLTGGRVRGCFHLIGGAGETLCICEGWATGASIYAATGYAVAVAFNAGNLEPVARAIRAKYADLKIIICGDADQSGAGQKAALEAARAVGGSVALPKFTADELATDNRYTDFNDMAQLRGLEAVAEMIRGAACAPETDQPEAPAKDTGGDFQNPLTEPAPTVSLLRASDIAPQPVDWIWPGWLAAGKVHILGGAPGTGKTTIAMALAGTISTGGRWPDGSRSQTGNVIVWSGEDDPADTLVPRLALAGADMDKIFFVADVRADGKSRPFDPARDMEALHRKLIEVGGVKLLVVDPVVSAITGDSHKNAEVRRGLQPLADLAAAVDCALLGITHFSKGTGGRDPVERITGSLAFGAVARVVMVAARHLEQSDDGGTKRLLLRAKSNIGPDDGGFGYDFEQAELESAPDIFASHVIWGDAVEGAARDLLAVAETVNDSGDGRALGEAKQFLSDFLSDGPQPVRVIRSEANDAGHSWATLRRAKTDLGVIPKKTGVKEGWEWSLPPRCSNKAEGAYQNSVSTFAQLEHLRGDAGELEADL